MRHALVATILTAAVTSSAHASPDPRDTVPTLSIPLQIGGGNDGFVYGVRPELLIVHIPGYNRLTGWGGGVSGEADRLGGTNTIGGGVTGVRYTEAFRLALTGGMYRRLGEATGYAASLGFGYRDGEGAFRPNDYHAGLRLTGRTDREQTSLDLAFEADTLWIIHGLRQTPRGKRLPF